MRAIKNRIKRQGNKGRKKRRGRPNQKIQKQRQRREGLSKKKQAAFIWDHQDLIVRKQEELSEQEIKPLTDRVDLKGKKYTGLYGRARLRHQRGDKPPRKPRRNPYRR